MNERDKILALIRTIRSKVTELPISLSIGIDGKVGLYSHEICGVSVCVREKGHEGHHSDDDAYLIPRLHPVRDVDALFNQLEELIHHTEERRSNL